MDSSSVFKILVLGRLFYFVFPIVEFSSFVVLQKNDLKYWLILASGICLDTERNLLSRCPGLHSAKHKGHKVVVCEPGLGYLCFTSTVNKKNGFKYL